MGDAGKQRADDSVDPRMIRALVLLTMTAGMIDAVTFLGLGEVFAANMTGNLVVLGFAIAGAPTLSIGGPAVALGAFLAGAGLAGRLERPKISRHMYVVRLIRIEIAVVALAALLSIGFDAGDEPLRFLVIGVLAGGMGVRNETIRRIDVPELRTTVLTLAIAGFAAHEAEHAYGMGDRLRIAGITAMIAGAVISALLVLNASLAWALAAIVVVEAVTLLALGGAEGSDSATVGG